MAYNRQIGEHGLSYNNNNSLVYAICGTRNPKSFCKWYFTIVIPMICRFVLWNLRPRNPAFLSLVRGLARTVGWQLLLFFSEAKRLIAIPPQLSSHQYNNSSNNYNYTRPLLTLHQSINQTTTHSSGLLRRSVYIPPPTTRPSKVTTCTPVLSIDMELPLSPSLSEAPTPPGQSQAPVPSVRESLPSYGISIERAELWKCEYNRQEVPLMRDEDFWELVAAIAKDSYPADVQSKLKSSIDQKSTRLHDDFEDAAYGPLWSGYEVFPAADQKFTFTRGLSRGITIHDTHAFMAYCLPYLIELAQKSKAEPPKQKASPGQKRKPKAQQQNTKSPAHKQPPSQQVSKQSSRATRGGWYTTEPSHCQTSRGGGWSSKFASRWHTKLDLKIGMEASRHGVLFHPFHCRTIRTTDTSYPRRYLYTSLPL